MVSGIPAEIAPYTAAKLILLDEVQLSNSLSLEKSRTVIDALAALSVEEIINIIDRTDVRYYTTDDIPQFGSIASLIKVPELVLKAGSAGLNYAQLGFELKNDVYAKMDANIKFGENHGKGAALLGLVRLNAGRCFFSSLTTGFCDIKNDKEKSAVIHRLLFRIPIVQAILKETKNGYTNGYKFMKGMKESTQKRRGQCMRAIFRELESWNNSFLSDRISNISWEI